MNLSFQPITPQVSALPTGLNGIPAQALQSAVALKPSLAYQAAGQALGGAAGVPLAQLNTPLNPLRNSFNLSGTLNHSDSQIKKVSKDFESIFVRMLFSEMRKTVEKNPLFGNSRAMEFFESMQDDQMSNQIASRGGFGIGKAVYQRLKAATSQHQKVLS
jgi:peptidoglycan hydrolase FlgJ